MTQENDINMMSVTLTEAGRLDKSLTLALEKTEAAQGLGLSRARVQQLLKGGNVTHEGAAVTEAKRKTAVGDVYDIVIPPPIAAEPEPEDIPLSIIYEDDDVLVLDKAAGMVVHPAAGNQTHTLVNALLHHCGDSLSGIGGVARPGIVHRLDKDTSGLMVVAKNNHAHQKLTAQFSDRSLSRVYQAVVWGIPNPLEGEIEGNIGRHPKSRQKMAIVPNGGKEALTYYETLETFGIFASLVQCRLATGRTHQIRVHMSACGYPLLGDPLYGRRKQPNLKEWGEGVIGKVQDFGRQALHAAEIKFKHPRTGKRMRFNTELPADLAELIEVFRENT